jgi:hypothetical protein
MPTDGGVIGQGERDCEPSAVSGIEGARLDALITRLIAGHFKRVCGWEMED